MHQDVINSQREKISSLITNQQNRVRDYVEDIESLIQSKEAIIERAVAAQREKAEALVNAHRERVRDALMGEENTLTDSEDNPMQNLQRTLSEESNDERLFMEDRHDTDDSNNTHGNDQATQLQIEQLQAQVQNLTNQNQFLLNRMQQPQQPNMTPAQADFQAAANRVNFVRSLEANFGAGLNQAMAQASMSQAPYNTLRNNEAVELTAKAIATGLNKPLTQMTVNSVLNYLNGIALTRFRNPQAAAAMSDRNQNNIPFEMADLVEVIARSA